MKTFGKKQPPAPPPWRPDFRDPTSLPDVKVVRTSFFVNGFCVFLFAAILILVGLHETKRGAIREDIRLLEQRMEENRGRNNQVTRMQTEYVQQERLLRQISEFLEGSLDLSAFLATLGDTLPEGMIVSNIRYQDARDRGTVGKMVQINGSIAGTPDSAATAIMEYIRVFTENPVFAAKIEGAVVNSLVPTPEGNLMAFGIQLTVKNKAPAPAATTAAR